MKATRDIPTPYLIAGAVAVLGVLASPARRLILNVPVLMTIGGALLGRKEGKSESAAKPAARAKAKPAAKARRKPAAKSPKTAT